MDPSAPNPTGPDAVSPSAQPDPYEFTPDQNALIARLASKMLFVGLFALGLGIAAIVVGAVRRDVSIIFSGSLYAVIGLWTERSGRSFRFIALTKGQDIRHLMHALEDLRRLYTLQFWICFLALVATVVLLGASVAARVD